MPRSPCWLRSTLASAIAVPSIAVAQAPPQSFSYATYFECDPAREARADALMREQFFPIFDRQLAAKRLVAWGWLAHNLGGHWRRAGYMVASTRDEVLDAQSAVLKEMQARSKAFAELTSICPRHEDYIWASVASSRARAPGASTRPPARMGVYYECDAARQDRADTLVTQAFAPIWDRHISSDGMSSWGWVEHAVGGKYRRLLLLNGASHKAILATVDQILAETGKERAAEGMEFSQICHSHQDYLWDIQAAKP